MALVPIASGVCIDLYEGALVQRAEDGAEHMWPSLESIDAIDASTIRALPARGIVPQSNISQVQASEACAHASKRLCTLAEWTAACRGRPKHDDVYPYGDTYDPSACNEGHDTHVARGGTYAKCKSRYGVFDMHGNVHEWVADSPETDSTKGIFMGGYFIDAKINGPGCEYETTAHAKTYHDYSTGFRCCADPLR